MTTGLATVHNTLRLLQQFSYSEPVLGVSELARRLGLGKSTVHRMLTTLRDEGFVQKTPDDRYRLGLRLYDLGQLVVSSLELREVAPCSRSAVTGTPASSGAPPPPSRPGWAIRRFRSPNLTDISGIGDRSDGDELARASEETCR